MRYRGELTIPANTPESSAVTGTVCLCYGLIRQVFILFPAGHAGLTHLQVCYHERQIFPTTPGQSFTGDDVAIEFSEQQPIFEEPFEIMLRAWNLDESYEHTIHCECYVERPQIYTPVVIASPVLPVGV